MSTSLAQSPKKTEDTKTSPPPSPIQSLSTDPLNSNYDPLHPSNSTSLGLLTKNSRVPQPKHYQPPAWRPPNEPAAITTRTINKMLILHPRNTFLKDDQVLDNVYNSSLNNNNAWKCVECLKVFYMKNRLKLHYMLEHVVGYCHLCDVFLDGEEEKMQHKQRMHDGKTCDFCYVHVSDSELSEHHRLEHDVVSCPYCLAYIRPSSKLVGHVVNTHRLKVDVDNPDVPKLFKQTGRESFRCFLCAESRKRELAGHFNMFHKVQTYVMADIFRKCNIDFTLLIEGISENDPSINAACEVCKEIIPEVVPTEFHFVYCHHQFYCQHCNMTFQTFHALRSHNKFLHERHPCKLDCANLAYNSAGNLTRHYLAYHKVKVCAFCDEIVSMEIVDADDESNCNLRRHFKMVHACVGQSGSNNGATTLLEIVVDDDLEGRQLSCCLCNDILPSINPNEVFLHFIRDHSVASHRILTLIGTNLLAINSEEDDQINIDVDETASNDEKDKQQIIKEINEMLFPRIFDEQYVKCLFEFADINKEFEIKCELCPEEFEDPLQYIAHLYSFHNLNIPDTYLKCHECEFQKNRSNELLLRHLNHYIAVENEEDKNQKFTCNLCNGEISLLDAHEHYTKQHKKLKDKKSLKKYGYKCRFCKQTFWNEKRRDGHEYDSHFDTNMDKFYICQVCNAHFSTLALLRHHKVDCDAIYNPPILYHCLLCSLVLPTIAESTQHFEGFHENMLRFRCLHHMCKGSFKNRRIVRRHYFSAHSTKKPKGTIVFRCNLCGQSFPTKTGLGVHKNVHLTQKRLFKCTICPERFQTKSMRNHHVQAMHIGEHRFKCPDCDEMFQSKTSLSMHRTSHKGQLICTYCQKEFSRRDSYKEHLLIHEGPRHQCPHCPRAFTQMSNLKRHLRIHTGEKPYKCAFCDKTFSDVGACKSHTSIHTREQECECNICGKKYSKRQKLRYHLKTHTGEDMHPCYICHKNFVGRYALRVHLTSHENGGQATVYLCDLCTKECKNKGSLTNHRKKCKGVPLVPKRKYNVKPRDPTVKRKYVKKNKTKSLEDGEDGQSEKCLSTMENIKNPNENNSTMDYESANEYQEDDPSKDLISPLYVSEMMATSSDTNHDLNVDGESDSIDNDEDNISIKKLKNALTNKMQFSKEMRFARPEYKIRHKLSTRQYTPNTDIIKSDVLFKLSSALKCSVSEENSTFTGVSVKREQCAENEDYSSETEENGHERVAFVDIKVEPKEEQMLDHSN